jgi:hypothetical protein
MAGGIVTAISKRSFTVADNPGRVVVASVGMPMPDSAGDWRCAFHIEGIESGGSFDAHGIDALQAMLLAIEGIRKVLDDSRLTLSWSGGEPGDTGIPHMIPLSLPAATRREIERYIDFRANAFAKGARRRRLLRSAWHILASRIRRGDRSGP